MDNYIRQLNAIKSNLQHDWLTTSQLEVLKSLKIALRAPCTVNLYGAAGVGKTFSAWIIAEELGFAYLPDSRQIREIENHEVSGIILDNCKSDRKFHRDLLRQVNQRDFLYAVFISRQLIEDYTRFVELKLNQNDREVVQRNLANIGITIKPDAEKNLWQILNPTICRSI